MILNISKTCLAADIFVFDAFGVSHREECTTVGVADYLDTVAGLNIKHEINTIKKLVESKLDQ